MSRSTFKAVLKHLKEEVINVIPAVIYFAIAFNLIHFTVGLALEPGDARYFTPLTVTLGALVVGKVLIIANSFSFINAFPQKPLIYNIVWKFFIYTFLLLLFWIAESLIHLGDKYRDLHDVSQNLTSEMLSKHFWSTELWVWSVFFIFVVANEYIRVLGRKRILEILLGAKQ